VVADESDHRRLPCEEARITAALEALGLAPDVLDAIPAGLNCRNLDEGEAARFALALHSPARRCLPDRRNALGRAVAQGLGLSIAGTARGPMAWPERAIWIPSALGRAVPTA